LNTSITYSKFMFDEFGSNTYSFDS
jgi:hypothetical protein